MVTKKFRSPTGMHADTDHYTFMCRLGPEDRKMLQVAHARLTAELGDRPSNAVLLSALLDNYNATTP